MLVDKTTIIQIKIKSLECPSICYATIAEENLLIEIVVATLENIQNWSIIIDWTSSTGTNSIFVNVTCNHALMLNTNNWGKTPSHDDYDLSEDRIRRYLKRPYLRGQWTFSFGSHSVSWISLLFTFPLGQWDGMK